MTIRSTKLGLAALLATSLAGAAFAQSATDTDLTAQANAEASVETRLGATEVPETLGELMADLGGDGVAIPTGEIPDDTQVTTMTLGDLEGEGADRAAALDNALARAQTSLDMLQTQVDGSEVLTEALEAEGFSSDNVLGVYQDANGSVTVLIDDRA
ncbi:hypothetical protein KUV62_04520 [Salipiger bermudensis]|uniref:hypothetical protein n=1 Tax=Salipiger bermudensis TaxID=344736 RepID=UPI001C9A00C2|nr:hypothetical protein [Salipiger bermudensis]MBY6003159.1 hypothetical protein [Salipiger bermudensis]